MNSFQFNIFQEINKSSIGKNMMISPISIYHILSLTANGAKNKTLSEMLTALCNKNKQEINENNKSISSAIGKFHTVEFANAVFTKVKTEKTFKDAIKEYKAKVDRLQDANQVNKWCSDATHKKIPKIIDVITPNDLIVLINAIYFNGTWMNPFQKEKNTKNDFMNFNKEPKNVEFMNIKEPFPYFENEEYQAISLKYNKDSLSAIIILPQKESDINNFIQNFTYEKYNFIIKNAFQKKVALSLPKFEINFEAEIKPNLMSLGMNNAFNDNADFSDMYKGSKIYIGRVIHKTYIKVDEKGTKAAAATAVVMRMKGISIDPVMNVNHPFLFIIRADNLPAGHDILFISKVECL